MDPHDKGFKAEGILNANPITWLAQGWRTDRHCCLLRRVGCRRKSGSGGIANMHRG